MFNELIEKLVYNCENCYSETKEAEDGSQSETKDRFKCLLNWKATTIRLAKERDAQCKNTENKKVEILGNADSGNQCLKADAVVVTVPLAVMSELKFEPSLPPPKTASIEKVSMNGGMKIILLFRRKTKKPNISNTNSNNTTANITFKAARNAEIIFAPNNQYCRQIWFRRDHSSVLITGFVMAECAQNLRQLIDSEIAQCKNKDELGIEKIVAANSFLEELKLLFGSDLQDAFFGGVWENTSIPSKNKKNYDASAFFDWKEHATNIKGVYSSPTINTGWYINPSKNNTNVTTCEIRTMRHDLAEPVAGCIFFAGEHTSTKNSSCVQSALETGIRASKEVLAKLLS